MAGVGGRASNLWHGAVTSGDADQKLVQILQLNDSCVVNVQLLEDGHENTLSQLLH